MYKMFEHEKKVDDMMVIARLKDPQKMAHYLYFLIKQDPTNFFISSYDENVRKTAEFLHNIFNWGELEIAKMVFKLDFLTAYAKKRP